MKIMKPRKVHIGDVVDYSEDAILLKMSKHPMDITVWFRDQSNPHLQITDSKNMLPEQPQKYLVSDVRDMFDSRGYKIEVCKVYGLINGNDGWLPASSLEVIVKG